MPPLWRTESFNSRKVLQWVARLGYWARGITYLAVGWLAILAVLSDTQTPTLKGAFTAIVEQSVGWLLLALLAGRLILHGVWRSIQAVLYLHGAGGGLKELTKRAGSLVSAALDAGLGLLAAADSVVLTLAAVSVHMLAMLATTGSVALLVYDWVGVAILRRGWINLDLLWIVALTSIGLFLLLTGLPEIAVAKSIHNRVDV